MHISTPLMRLVSVNFTHQRLKHHIHTHSGYTAEYTALISLGPALEETGTWEFSNVTSQVNFGANNSS